MIGNGTAPSMLPIKQIRRDDGTQARLETNEDLAREYAEAMQAEDTFPAPTVFHDGKDYWLADGWHTVRAHEIAGWHNVTVNVRKGTKRDAILFAVGANVRHGKRRTHGDLRKAVTMLLEDEEWSKCPNTWIANQCACNEGTVRNVRRELKEAAEQRARGTSQNGFAPIVEEAPAYSQVSSQERQLTLEERMEQIEDLAGRLRRLLGDGEDVRPALEVLTRYLALLRDAMGWEEEPEVVFDEQLLKGAKALVGRMRKLHAELPAARRATKILDSLSATLARAATGRKESTSVAC